MMVQAPNSVSLPQFAVRAVIEKPRPSGRGNKSRKEEEARSGLCSKSRRSRRMKIARRFIGDYILDESENRSLILAVTIYLTLDGVGQKRTRGAPQARH